MRRIPLCILTSIALASPAAAQDASTPGALELYATQASIGVRLGFTGDADGDATARLEWRPAGATSWIEGVPMTLITGSRWAGSVLGLGPDTPYEVRAIIVDPDGAGLASAATRTRANVDVAPTGRDWWVSTSGDDDNPGDAARPFATLEQAAAHAQPGDAIRVRPGVYYQQVDAVRAGTSSAPIHLIADGPDVILDGSDPAQHARTDWRDDGGGVFSIPFTGTTRLVCLGDEQRLYRQASVTALRNGANGIAQGWVIEAGRLWIRSEDGQSPAGRRLNVARFNHGITLDQPHWTVSGFTLRYYGTEIGGAGIYLRADRCLLRTNLVHTIGGKGIYMRLLASDNMIESNTISDPRVGGWPWSATKGHEEEQQAISHRGGRGNVIRDNLIDGTFDGIDVAAGEADENVGADTDIHDNRIVGVGDDGLEPETISGINVRVWRNRVEGCFNGMSIAPNLQGPTYVLYNTFVNYRRGAFKFSIGSTGETWICHNTAVSTGSPTAALHPSGAYANMRFRNNILVGRGSAAVSDDTGESTTGNDFDGDLIHAIGASALFRWKGTNYSSIAALRSGTGFERQGRSGDPLFASPETGDWALQPDSPAVDAAIRLPGINDGYLGSAPDVGAHELGLDIWPPARVTDLHISP